MKALFKVEILFHDTPKPVCIQDATAVVHGESAVTVHRGGGIVQTYPWVNVQRVKEYPVISEVKQQEEK